MLIFPRVVSAKLFSQNQKSFFALACCFSKYFFYFSIDYKRMISDPDLLEAWPTLENDLEDNAEFVLGGFGLGLSRLEFLSSVFQI